MFSLSERPTHGNYIRPEILSAETLIFGTLTANGPLTALVATRIYPDFLSQEITLPAIVTQRVESEYVNTIHTGAAAATRITMDTWCLAATRIGAEALADAVEVALPAGLFVLTDRRIEFDPDTETFAAVVTSKIWP